MEILRVRAETEQSVTDLYNGLSKEELANFLRGALGKARRLGFSWQVILDLVHHNEFPIEITPVNLNRFTEGETRHLRNETAIELYRFFTTTEMGRAILSAWA